MTNSTATERLLFPGMFAKPGALALSALLLHARGLLPVALIWTNHIGVDRLLGCGLKYADGFKWTHLGRLGKGEATSPCQESQARPA